MLRALLPVAVAFTVACHHKAAPTPVPSGRCEVDLASTGLFAQSGTTARAKVAASAADLIGGQYAQGQVGDVVMQNDKIRAVIEQPGRWVNPILFGGIPIDLDVQRPAGERGHDQFGRMGPLYAFGRTINATKVEILSDGSTGGPAVVAATGPDTLNNYAHISLSLSSYGLGQLVISPEQPLPLLMTTYYVLSPGESRLRMLSAVCNQGSTPVVMPIGDLMDIGGTVEYFNPQACTHALGNKNCLADPALWYGLQGSDDVAYGVRAYQYDKPTVPDTAGIIAVVGIIGTVAGAQDEAGILSWLDSSAATRPGAFIVLPGKQKQYLRDLFVGHSLADVSSAMLDVDNAARVGVDLTLQNSDGTPAPGARVAIMDSAGANEVTLAIADSAGQAHLELPSATYQVSAASAGHAITPATSLALPASGSLAKTLTVGPAHLLTVHATDSTGAPIAAKVTVLCPSGTCPQPVDSYRTFADPEFWPTNLADIEFVPPQGDLTFPLPPGAYQVVVTHGPEFSTFPDTWPNQGYAVDLTTADQTVTAALGHVVDTTGWMSADLHVHAVDSSDSSVVNARRVLGFAAEGVDIICSTDHDYVTDYGPVIRSLQAENAIASIIGDELSTFDFGHFNLYPLTLDPTNPVNGGAFDWGGQDNNHTMLLTDIFGGVRKANPNAVVQINHGRGSMGVLTKLQVDTATGASHADPTLYRLPIPANSTANDTMLFSDNFDAIEVQNGLVASTALLNDWMTFLSRGAVKTATAVSDTHYNLTYAGGDSRTFVNLGVDLPSQFQPDAFATALKAHQAIGTNAPFVRLQGTRLSSTGTAVGPPVGIGGTISVHADAGESLRLDVDVQSPEWANFDSIELYTYAPGRESFNGQENDTWAPPAQSQALNLATLPVEAVPGLGPGTYRRIHVQTQFTVQPSFDTWYVVMVRGSSAANSLFPMVMHGASCSGSTCTANSSQAFAFTNPIFVDGDGDGLYDHPPLPPSVHMPWGPTPPPPPGRPADRHALFERLMRDVEKHHCGG